MAILILLRHGQSIYNLENRFTGILDIGLTELGKQEAEIAGLKLINFKFDFAYTSILKRANESLRILLKIINQNICNALKLTTNISETEMYMLLGSGKVVYNQFASQQRYDFLLENFCKIIKLLKANPFYFPQKSELKVTKLEDFYASLYLNNNEVKRSNALLSNACLIRTEVMYRAHNGLVALATTAKMYIKYHYGWNSLQFKQVSGLKIKNQS